MATFGEKLEKIFAHAYDERKEEKQIRDKSLNKSAPRGHAVIIINYIMSLPRQSYLDGCRKGFRV